MGKSALWLTTFTLVLTGFLTARAQPEANFKCSSSTNATCRALIDYFSQNATTLRDIQKLFNVKHLPDVLGANANTIPENASGSYSVAPKQVVRIPFPCKCSNGTGLSNHVPLYKIKPGDGLDYIARTVFAGVVTYQQIQKANNISDANKIIAGDSIWIPLPCSCDSVGGSSVVHYAYIVPLGSSVEGIAQEFGTTEQIILSLNGIDDPKKLQAQQVIDVPLKACSTSVKNNSMDYPLLVSNSTYVYTANECVKCKCDSSNNYVLQCEPSQLKPTGGKWSVCPSMKCTGNLTIGNLTSASDDPCNRTFCAYAGYSFKRINTILANESTCPAPAPAPSGGSVGPGGSGSGASRTTFGLIIVLHFILLALCLL
ncbi:lysM domain-containing GPI-anchored protein 2 [Arachis stenosperma]|uniref:lysM domain-containing GPI-anchored protein 2 n=1 Tax=Arachis stenosperma TaxID=217475 RepID=UPI0025ACAC15|nr:lysM domain-containing GPI-anchored protein 2 [Arachis stenosperma]